MGQPLPLPQQRLRQTKYATFMGNGSIIVTKTLKRYQCRDNRNILAAKFTA
jgi:hypothetical protein